MPATSYAREIEEARDIVEGSFVEFARGESFVSDGERAWLRWVKKVEKLLGHDLDGDQDRDGYSLDTASDYETDGFTPAEYVAQVMADKALAVART